MRVGSYELLDRIGEGGVGTVFRARAPGGETVAVKVLRTKAGNATQRFQREKRLLESLGQAEGFVPLLDAGEAAAGSYFVMPFLEGGTLRERLKRGPLAIDETVELGRTLAHALGEAHARGIVHRDVKPENILFTREGRPLVADLGLAKHYDREAAGASRSIAISVAGSFLGTATYMSPEQAKDAKSAGPAADVYALGAVLYECLAGAPAFVGDSVVELVKKAMEARYDPLAPRRKDAPAWLVAAIERALARNPAKRPPDGHAFEESLVPVPANRVPLVMGIALAVLVLAGLAALLLRERHRKDEARAFLARGIAEYRRRAYAPARPDLERAIELDPSLVEARAWRVLVLSRTKEATLADADAVIALAPRLAMAWVARGDVRELRGDTEGGIADTTKAIELDGRLAMAWSGRASVRLVKGDLTGVISDVSRAIELDPERAYLWELRGCSKYRKGELEGAIADIGRAIELDPLYAEYWRNRGLMRGARGDLDGEIADETKALELDPRDSTDLLQRALALARKGALDRATADATRAIELAPEKALAWRIRGQMRGESGDDAGAFEDMSRALELDPRDANAWAGRGVSFLQKGQLDAGIADLTHAIELDPTVVEAWLNRGMALQAKGDVPNAIADLERFLELAGDAPQAAEARKRLDALRRGH